MSRLAERLLELRGDEAQGVFAARLGLKQAVYCHYEKGRREPSLDTLIHMALVLHRTTDYLLGLSEEPAADVPSVQAGGNSQVAIGNQAPVIYARRNVTINTGNATVESEKERARRERAIRKFKFK